MMKHNGPCAATVYADPSCPTLLASMLRIWFVWDILCADTSCLCAVWRRIPCRRGCWAPRSPPTLTVASATACCQAGRCARCLTLCSSKGLINETAYALT